MEFRVLGPLEARHEGRPVAISGSRQRALLAVLGLHAGEGGSADRLLDLLWGADPPAGGTATLRVRISQLRRSLAPGGDAIVTRAPGYLLRVEDERLDLRRFERLAREGEVALARGDAQQAASALEQALALWYGPPLDDVA